MLLSPTARIAIRALIYLASRSGDGPVPGREIAAAEKIPPPFLAKILHRLGGAGLVKSTKGPHGGYELGQAPDRVLIGEVVGAIDGPLTLSDVCLLGLEKCGDTNPCALHDTWKIFRGQFQTRIWELTLSEAVLSNRRNRTRNPA